MYELFKIYYSFQTGKLLEVIAGHDGPVSSLDFSPSVTSSSLASVSWDKTLRTWNAIAVGSAGESVQIGSDGTAVCYRYNHCRVISDIPIGGYRFLLK